MYIQGPSWQSGYFKLTLTDRNMQVRFCLKVSVYSWGWEIWVSSTSFQKSNIGWPQQPLTEKELKFKMGFHDSVKKIFFQNIKIKLFLPSNILNSRSRMTLKSSVVIFWALETSAASLTSAASATSLASTASKALFPQKTSWSWWFDHQWHQNDQYRSFFVEWIIKNTNFHWYMVPFLLEAVEANLCYFFENWLMKLKFPNLRNIQIPSN